MTSHNGTSCHGVHGEGFDARQSDVCVKYPEVDSPDCEYDWSVVGVNDTLVDERIIRKAGFPFCTNAYAITAKGAEKLLLRTSLFIDGPIDVTVAQEIDKQHLAGYELFPPPTYQWRYVDVIGADGLNSDIASEKGCKRVVVSPKNIGTKSKTPIWLGRSITGSIHGH